jgi:hypothetical protein
MRDKEMSPIDKIKASRGEDNQGNYLVNAKERHSEKKQRRDSQQRTISRPYYPSSASKADRFEDYLRA